MWFALALIFCFAFAVRVFRLDFYSLWYDEANTAYLLQGKSVSEGLTSVLSTSGSETLHPLYYFLLSAWMQLAGSSEWALRLPSVVFGSLAALVFAFALHRKAGMKGLALGSLLVVSPFLTWYSRDARPYALIVLLSGVNLLCFVKLVGRPASKCLWVAFVTSGTLMIYSGVLTGMVIAAELLWVIMFRRNIRLFAAVFVIAMISVPLVMHGFQTHFTKSSGRYSKLPGGMSCLRAAAIPQEFYVGRSLGPTPEDVRSRSVKEVVEEKRVMIAAEAASLICALGAIVTALLVSRRKGVRALAKCELARILAFTILVCLLQVVLLVVLTDYRMNARHIAFLFGPLFLLAAVPVASSSSRTVVLVFLLSVGGVWGWSCGNQLFNSHYETDNYRDASRLILRHGDYTTPIVAMCNTWGLRYYGVENPITYFAESSEVTVEKLNSHSCSGRGHMWIVLSRPWNYSGFDPAHLDSCFAVVCSHKLQGIRLWLVRTQSDGVN